MPRPPQAGDHLRGMRDETLHDHCIKNQPRSFIQYVTLAHHYIPHIHHYIQHSVKWIRMMKSRSMSYYSKSCGTSWLLESLCVMCPSLTTHFESREVRSGGGCDPNSTSAACLEPLVQACIRASRPRPSRRPGISPRFSSQRTASTRSCLF